MERDQLAAAFLGHAAAPSVDAGALGERLAEALAAGRAATPGVEVDGERFAAYLAARAPTPDAIAALALTDLYLACACATGVPHALAAFDRAFARDLGAALGSMGVPPPERDDVLQAVREKLFVGSHSLML